MSPSKNSPCWQRQAARQPAVRSHAIGHLEVLELVAADGDGHVAGDVEGPGEKLVVPLDVRAQAVAVLEGGPKASLQDPGLELPRAVQDVVDAARPR